MHARREEEEGEGEGESAAEDGYVVRRLRAGLLRDLSIVDTPGTNVILERQQRLTEEFVPRADLVLFTMSAGAGRLHAPDTPPHTYWCLCCAAPLVLIIIMRAAGA